MTDLEESAGKSNQAGWALVGLGMVFLFALGLRTIAYGEIWGHLATGRWIAEHGIPRVDVFSFTAEGRPWVVDTWLYDRILFSLWGLGPAAVIILHTLAVAGAYVLLLCPARRYAGPASIAAALVLCGWLTAPVLTVGPATGILIFPAVMIFLLYRKRPTALAWGGVLAAQLAWANMHVSFFLGPLICLAFAYDAGRRARLEEEDEEDEAPYYGRKQLLLLAAAAVAVTFINPYVSQLHAHAFATWADPATRLFHTWISPYSGQFGSPLAKHMLTLGLAVGALGLLTYRERLPGGLTAVAILGAALGVTKGSHPHLFALLAFPFFALSVGAGARYLLRVVEKRAPRQVVLFRGAGSLVAGLLALASTAAVATGAYYRASGSASAPGLDVNYGLFPEHAAELIEHPQFPERALNLVQDGGFLAWRYPDHKVFIDQRARLYGGVFYLQLMKALSGDAQAWGAIEEEFAPEAVILNCTLPGAGPALRDLTGQRRWNLAYLDGTTAILLKDLPHLASLANDAELQASGLQHLEADHRRYRERLRDASGAAAAPSMIGAGNAFLHLHRFKEAAAAYALLVSGVPSMDTARANLGFALLQDGQAEQAVQMLEAACERMKEAPMAWLWLSTAYVEAGRHEDAERAFARAEYLDAEAAEAYGNPASRGGTPGK